MVLYRESPIISVQITGSILSGVSTSSRSSLLSSSLGCHGDDVILHHEFSPVTELRGGRYRETSRNGSSIRERAEEDRTSVPASPPLPFLQHHARDCAPASRPVRQPDRSQGKNTQINCFLRTDGSDWNMHATSSDATNPPLKNLPEMQCSSF